MKDPIIYDCNSFPAQLFGEGIVRQVRLIASPETTGEERIRIVTCTVPAGGISEGHIHPDADEYIYFDIGGSAKLDDVEYPVPPKGLLHAKAGIKHECINTSETKILTLYCVFVPHLKPYGSYPELIKLTNEYLSKE